MIFLLFPWLYQQAGLEAVGKTPASFFDAVLYSMESAVIMGHDTCNVTSTVGRFLTFGETALSYFGLGAALWHVTKKIE